MIPSLDITLAVKRPWQLGPESKFTAAYSTPYSHMEYLGRVNRQTGYKTSYKPTQAIDDILGDRPVQFVPAPQSAGIERGRVGELDANPHVSPSEEDELYFRLAQDWLTIELKNSSIPSDAFTALSFDDAVSTFLASEPDSRKASCGFLPGFKCRTKEEALNTPGVLEHCRAYYNSLFTDEPNYTVFSSSLKDEMLKVSKAEAGKTRMFMVASVEHHIACYAIFSKFSKALFGADTFCTGGTPFQFGGWHYLMLTRLYHSHYVFADCDAYDISHRAFLFGAACDALSRMYPVVLRGPIRALFAQALHTIFVTGYGDVLWKHQGNPSGWYLTLIVNTLILYLLTSASFMKMYASYHQGKLPHFQKFKRNVNLNLIGDDSVFNVTPKYFVRWTDEDITDFWLSVGIKVKIMERTDNIEHVEYCGATSKFINGRLARVPRISKFLDSLRWTRNRDLEYIYARAAAICIELWPCSEEYELVSRFLKLLRDANPLVMTRVAKYFSRSESELAYYHLGLEGGCKQMSLNFIPSYETFKAHSK